MIGGGRLTISQSAPVVVIRRVSVPTLTTTDRSDAADAGLMFANWSNAGEGDLNGDNIVDAADAGILFAAWTGDAPEPADGQATAAYNYMTGLIEISAKGVVNAFVESASGGLTPGDTDAGPAGLLVSDNASRVGLTGFWWNQRHQLVLQKPCGHSRRRFDTGSRAAAWCSIGHLRGRFS